MIRWLLLLLLCLSARGDIIPPELMMTWQPNVNVGVPGGIPTRTNIFCTITSSIPGTNIVAYGDGVTDSGPAFSAAVSLCPSGQVIYIPTGRYLCSNGFTINSSGRTLRGDGMSNTVLIGKSQSARQGFIEIGRDSNEQGGVSFTGGTKGSSNITVTSGTGISAGTLVTLSESNRWFVRDRGGTLTNLLKQMVVVKSVSAGTNLTFWPPLVWDYTNSNRLRYHLYNVKDTGLENFSIVSSNTQCPNAVFVYETSGGWIRGVESAGTPQRHFYFIKSVNWEVSSNYVHEAIGGIYGPNVGPGIELYSKCTGFLIENNICYRCWPSIMLEDGSCGTVVGYNFSHDHQSGVAFQGGDLNSNHSAHNVMNLWEGNSSSMFESDGYHGSQSHTVAFRNMFHTQHPTLTQGRKAINQCRWTYYGSFVGNVLGWPVMSGTWYYNITNIDYGYEISSIYRFGYPNSGNASYTGNVGPDTSTRIDSYPSNDQRRDLTVEATTYLHGNYDYLTASTVWNSTNADHTLPASLYRSTKPSWFGSTAWPAFGPDVAGLTNKIPAQLRFEGAAIPTAGFKLRIYRR